MPDSKDRPAVLVLGSAPGVASCKAWPKTPGVQIVAINNAWRVRDDWDYLISPDDFPAERKPKSVREDQRLIKSSDYVPANNKFGGVFYAGGTMAFTAGYWALEALKPRVLAFLGCDMIYPATGKTHFYGKGQPDPLRDDKSLRNLEAKSARLMMHALQKDCACVRLSVGESRLLFPSVDYSAVTMIRAAAFELANHKFKRAKQLEERLNYHVPSGRYWKADGEFDIKEIDRIDGAWLDAASVVI